jgi:ADP-dependent NAD(P)H-hydrate dehydratase / NAD(P)H-hydrate epimerase
VKIFSVSQIKAWDAYTIQNEPVASIDLMQRAAESCFNWIQNEFDKANTFIIFCSTGNNGGDGLAIAKLLIENGYPVSVYIIKNNNNGSEDFQTNFERLKQVSNSVYFLDENSSFPDLKNKIVIDALFGTGLNKNPSGVFSKIINYINQNSETVVSIDIPSGLYVDKSSVLSNSETIVKATYTLTFQNQKLAFLMPENDNYVGKIILLNIGLSNEFEEKEDAQFIFTDEKLIKKIYRERSAFSNKGNFGYACMLAGSYGMMGAAVLSSKACLRSGVGKLTCFTCKTGYDIIQASVPEAMCKTFGNKFVKDVRDFEDFDVIGIGPGIGKHFSHKELLQNLFSNFKKPLVIDADALNVLSENTPLYKSIPKGSILTPHPKEFQRLFGKTNSDFERINLALSKAKELDIYIILKGHFTFIATPEEKGFFNSTGNAGMATAGAGDVLTGIITGLLAQNYSSLEACILAVYLHGLAGDIAAEKLSEEALIAGDITENLGAAFKQIKTK